MAPPSGRAGGANRALKIIHLFANHKFTGPADLAMVLAAGQQAEGAEVIFISSQHPSVENTVDVIASSRGLTTLSGLRLPKHLNLAGLSKDVVGLRKIIDEHRPDYLHCHLDGDHLPACLATLWSGGDAKGPSRRAPRIIRSTYHLEPPRGLRASWMSRRTHLWLPPTETAGERLVRALPAALDRISVLAPPVDLERFHPEQETDHPDAEKPVVVGVVARMQRHRMFPMLIEAFAMAAQQEPRLQLEILGRGTHQDEVARIPARETGLGERIRFPGYISPDRYPQQLRQLDLLVFLVPGSDGTCRAAREALASGVPVISTRRGLLPDLIPDHGGALLADEEPETLCRVLLELAQDPQLRQNKSRDARKYASEHFDSKALSSALLDILSR